MVSIVIPTYNEAAYLPMLLASIKAQDFTDYEIIVADNNSPDDTATIAREAGARVVQGGLVAQGRNAGAAAAQGDILVFFDADVLLPNPDFLSDTISEFKKRKLGVATCAIIPISKRPVDKIFHTAFNWYMRITAARRPHAPGFCIFIKKTIHDTINGFDTEITLAEDHDYVQRAAKLERFGVLQSARIPVSVRRFDRDGRINIAVKYVLCELHMRTKGAVKSNIFNYTFGYNNTTAKTKLGTHTTDETH